MGRAIYAYVQKGDECLVTNGGHGAYGASNIVSTGRNIRTAK